MKRILAFLVAAIVTLALLTGCSFATDQPQTAPGGKVTSIMDVLDDGMLSIYKNRNAKLPAAVIYIHQGNGVRVESPLYGADDVSAVLDAIAAITVMGETDITVADSDSFYTFLNADGTEAGSVAFNGEFLACGDQKYEVQNTQALAAIDFPAESDRDTLAIDGPDPKMHAFLDRCKTEAPARIRVIRDNRVYEITQSDAIGDAVDALYSIGLDMYALRGAESPTTTLTATFVMNDGREYSLTFYDDTIYVYEYPHPLGIWSFYTNGADYFLEALTDAK